VSQKMIVHTQEELEACIVSVIEGFIMQAEMERQEEYNERKKSFDENWGESASVPKEREYDDFEHDFEDEKDFIAEQKANLDTIAADVTLHIGEDEFIEFKYACTRSFFNKYSNTITPKPSKPWYQHDIFDERYDLSPFKIIDLNNLVIALRKSDIFRVVDDVFELNWEQSCNGGYLHAYHTITLKYAGAKFRLTLCNTIQRSSQPFGPYAECVLSLHSMY